MSHFSVLVVGDDVDAALAPFQENNMGDCPEEFLEFFDVEDEYRHEYETGSETRWLLPGNIKAKPNDKKVQDALTAAKDKLFPDKHLKKEEAEKVCQEAKRKLGFIKEIVVPFKEAYSTFEEFMSEQCYADRDPKTGRYGYWENPNAKWDWYQVGGRWTGALKLKSNSKDYADSALKKDIDIEGMEKPMREAAEMHWDEFHEKGYADHFAACPEPSAKNPFHDFFQKVPKECREWIHNNLGFFASHDTIMQIATMDREEYVACQSVWSPYALVWDGKWYAKGDMGWFGISSNNESQWNGAFRELWKEIPDNAMITMVDCHI